MRFPVAFGRNCGTLNTMQAFRLTRPHVIAALLAVALAVPAAGWAATTTHHAHHARASHSTARHGRLHHASLRQGRGHRHPVVMGQREMDPQRATEIQQALLQAHYLDGTPTGQWDPQTQAAMQKYQADNGWQTKITPDSRALIKLGLGPKQDEGEYVTAAAGVSKLSSPVPTDPLSTMANSEMPAATQN